MVLQEGARPSKVGRHQDEGSGALPLTTPNPRRSLEPPQPAGSVGLGQPLCSPPFPPPCQFCQPLGHLALDPAQPEELLVPQPGGPHRGLLDPLHNRWSQVSAVPASPAGPPLPGHNRPAALVSSRERFSETTFLIHLFLSVVRKSWPPKSTRAAVILV